jgi:hypothetical protein
MKQERREKKEKKKKNWKKRKHANIDRSTQIVVFSWRALEVDIICSIEGDINFHMDRN